jgi:hypothetical protein
MKKEDKYITYIVETKGKDIAIVAPKEMADRELLKVIKKYKKVSIK